MSHALTSRLKCGVFSSFSRSAFAADVYKPVIRKGKAGENEMLWAGRYVVLIIAIIAVVIAANPNSGIQVFEILKMLIPKKWRESLRNKLRKNTKEERLKRLQQMLDEY